MGILRAPEVGKMLNSGIKKKAFWKRNDVKALIKTGLTFIVVAVAVVVVVVVVVVVNFQI